MNEERRVLMTADTIGGVWSHALELARVLSEVGIDVALATMGHLPSSAQRHEAGRIRGLTLFESNYSLEWMDDPWADVAEAGGWLRALEREVAPDVVHLNGYTHGAAAFEAPRVVVAHSCIASWWHAIHGEPLPTRYARYRDEVMAGLASADAVVAPTKAMLDALVSHYGPVARAHVVPNGIRLSDWRRGPKLPIVVAAGRLWDEAKNIAALAEVASALPWQTRIAGETKHPCGGRVHPEGAQFVGTLARAELAELMACAAIFAHPARYEPFGLAPLEAAASGCALVLGDIPSLREVWQDDALYVDPDDRGGLRATLCRLIEDERLRDEMGARAYARSRELSDLHMGARYRAVYAGLARTSRRSKPVRGERVHPFLNG